MNAEELMLAAIAVARAGIEKGQSPFGCSIALDGKIVASTHNTVWLTTDITAHAEVNAIREACRATDGILLEGAIVATTCEPCPMCMSALHWARVETVYFGATIDDAKTAGFNELTLPAAELLKQGRSEVKLIDDTLRTECAELFNVWKATSPNAAY